MIELINVYKSFDNDKTFVVKDVSLVISDGEIIVLLGSSGSGKTTLLKMINRLVELTAGKIIIDGIDIFSLDLIKLRRSIGYVFQGVGLFPHMTIEENIAISLRLNSNSRSHQKQRAYELLETVNLDPKQYAQRFPHELSGGQQQRVGVARSLASNPNCLLMDEPFAALDAINRCALQSELLFIQNSMHKTIVFVTHDLDEALRLGDRIAIMNQGQIEQIGTPSQLIDSPATPFVSELLQKVRIQWHQFKEIKSV